MTDYTARDIHLLDQALVDALEDVDGWTTDMDVRADLNERGIAIAGANLTAQLAENHTHMGLAGFTALATIRRIQEREQTKAYRVEMESLRAELGKAHAERDRFHGMYANAQQALRNLADAYTDATGTPVCNCCFVDGSTQRCGRPATTIVDVPPFGFLDVAKTCRSRITGEPAGEPERPAGVAR